MTAKHFLMQAKDPFREKAIAIGALTFNTYQTLVASFQCLPPSLRSFLWFSQVAITRHLSEPAFWPFCLGTWDAFAQVSSLDLPHPSLFRSLKAVVLFIHHRVPIKVLGRVFVGEWMNGSVRLVWQAFVSEVQKGLAQTLPYIREPFFS